MKRSISKDFPFYILLIIALVSVIDNIIDNEKFMLLKHYFGIGLLILSLVIYFVNYRGYKYIFTIVLFIGTFNIIYFTNPVYSISFGFKFLSKYEVNTLNIQSIALALLIIQVLVSRKEYYRKFMEFF
jgi:hypothetical protein